jgi:hypothetical protein
VAIEPAAIFYRFGSETVVRRNITLANFAGEISF